MMRWLLVGQDILLFLLPAFIVARIKSPQPLEWLHLKTGCKWQTLLLAVALMLVAQPSINLIAWANEQLTLPSSLAPWEEWMKQMEEANAATVAQLLGESGIGALLANLAVVALMAALSEEVLFRGMIQGLFTSRTVHTGIWVTAILFSLMHLQFYGFVPRMLMGALFGYILVWTGSLWVPITMHFVNNALAVLLTDVVWLEHFGREETWWVGALSLIATIVLSVLLYRRTQVSETKP